MGAPLMAGQLCDRQASPKLIGPPSGLRFEITLDLGSGQTIAGLAWGDLSLRFDGTPVWCAQDDGHEGPIRWTWIDLLEFLARNWPWLVLEESYPIPVNPSFPGALQRYAEYRWENEGLGDPVIEKEDAEVYRFLCRHDLAMGLQGLYLPSLILMRQGHQVLLSIPALGLDSIRPFHEIFDTLNGLGEHLAESLTGVAERRAELACDSGGAAANDSGSARHHFAAGWTPPQSPSWQVPHRPMTIGSSTPTSRRQTPSSWLPRA